MNTMLQGHDDDDDDGDNDDDVSDDGVSGEVMMAAMSYFRMRSV